MYSTRQKVNFETLTKGGEVSIEIKYYAYFSKATNCCYY